MRQARTRLLLLWLGSWSLAPGQAAEPQLPRASAVVEPHSYVSLEPVPRGRVFEVAVVAKIRPGFHINANRVTEDYLIPTTLEVDLPPGFRALDTYYPPGVRRSFAFTTEKLFVYDGSTTLRMKFQALPAAPLGASKLELRLRYQACNDEACLPPVSLPVVAEFEVVSVGAPARQAHPAIFQAQPRPRPQPPR